MPNEKHVKQQEVAASMVHAMGQMLSMTQLVFPESGEKLTLCMSAAMIGISFSAAMLSKAATMRDYIPTTDDVNFCCMVIANSIQFDRNGGLMVEFDPSNIIKALDQFKEQIGRSYEEQLDPSLLEVINTVRTKAAESAGSCSQFLPQ